MFHLSSKFKPTGDQPQAIAKLTRGLKSGMRHQTLLGVTGSGKSVVSNTPVLVKNSFGTTNLINIGELIDKIFEDFKNKIRNARNIQIIATDDLPKERRLQAYSFNPVSKINSWKKITHFTRHASPNKLYKITTACGREVTVTGDHNFFALQNGEFNLVETKMLDRGNYLPLPLKLEAPASTLNFLNLTEYLDAECLYFSLPEFKNIWTSKEKLLRPFLTTSKVFGLLKKNERVNSALYQNLLTVAPELSTGPKIGLRLGGYQTSPEFKLTDEFLRLLGYYIAEGHGEKGYLIISSGNPEIITDFRGALSGIGLRSRLRPNTYDYQINSRLWAQVVSKLCGTNSKNKHLPDFWPNLSQNHLTNLLRAYFSADGGIDGRAITCTTASESLALDLVYALLRFGIVARIRKKSARIPNKDIFGNYWIVSMSGQKFVKIFKEKLGFVISRKNLLINKIITGIYNTNVDLIPSTNWLKSARLELGLSQKNLQDKIDINRSYVSMLENGLRMPSREVFEKLVKYLRQIALEKGAQDQLKQIQEKTNLLNLYWSPIKCIEKVGGERFVYDFSVKDNETFMAGQGGLFVHNTFTIANVIANIKKPTLVISHNKTLAAQLYQEFREFFPHNSVHYFVSYYDYYQPEAYIPHSDTYIEKDARINEEIDRLRHAATQAVMTRDDVIIVASVSCIYNLGSPEDYQKLSLHFFEGQKINPRNLAASLLKLQYAQDLELKRGAFRKSIDEIEIVPATGDSITKIKFKSPQIKKISIAEGVDLDSLIYHDPTYEKIVETKIFPAKYWIATDDKIDLAITNIRAELQRHIKKLDREGLHLEAARLKERTEHDMQMIKQTGYCHGIENYSRHLDFRTPGDPPFTLIDFFKTRGDFLTVIDESHMTIPQLNGMHSGDYSRKATLVEYGFRLPSALDNRPLRFDEFQKNINQTIYISATPKPYEIKKSTKKGVVEQLVRPTGLLDPIIEIQPTKNQIKHLLREIQKRVANSQRVLVTTLTKRMAEDLSEHLADNGIKVNYIHSEIKTLQRLEIIHDLRLGNYDVLVGVNLLREGLDLPEVSLVAILDADKEGFLRNATTLIQTMGRAARHIDGHVIMYADKITRSMANAIQETERRRKVQEEYNRKHGITPTTIIKMIKRSDLSSGKKARISKWYSYDPADKGTEIEHLTPSAQMERLQKEMERAVKELKFERAMMLREQMLKLRKRL